jgi:hypothetical protein
MIHGLILSLFFFIRFPPFNLSFYVTLPYHTQQVSLDPKKFLGVASVPDAVEYLHSGKSVGKVAAVP